MQLRKLDADLEEVKTKFQAMRQEVKVAFDELQRSVEAERQKLNEAINDRETTVLADRKSYRVDLENLQASLSAHMATAERMIASAPDASLLAMLGDLKRRLEMLEATPLPAPPKSTPGSLCLVAATVDKFKTGLAALGKIKELSEVLMFCLFLCVFLANNCAV